MKVILCENVPNLGEMGATVKVAPGYARNFLLPRKLAVLAESGSAKQIEHEMRNIKRREEKLRTQLAEEAKKLESITIEIKAKAGEEDKIFGSVTTAQIAEALKPLGYAVDRKSIHLEEPIRTIGIHPAGTWVRLDDGSSARVVEQTDDLHRPIVEPATSPDGSPIAPGERRRYDLTAPEPGGPSYVRAQQAPVVHAVV